MPESNLESELEPKATLDPMPLIEFELKPEATLDLIPLPSELVTSSFNKSPSIQLYEPAWSSPTIVSDDHFFAQQVIIDSVFHVDIVKWVWSLSRLFWLGHYMKWRFAAGPGYQNRNQHPTNLHVRVFSWCRILKLGDEFLQPWENWWRQWRSNGTFRTPIHVERKPEIGFA